MLELLRLLVEPFFSCCFFPALKFTLVRIDFMFGKVCVNVVCVSIRRN